MLRSALILLLFGCPPAGPPPATEREGDEPGECADGADNDADGAFDCEDTDCAGAPACQGDDDDSADDDDAVDDDDQIDDDDAADDDDQTDDDDAVDDDDAADDDDSAHCPDLPGDPACIDDSYEPFDSRECAAAATEGITVGYQICPGDEDWWSLWAEPGELVAAAALFEHAEGNIDIALYDPAGTLVGVGDSESSNDLATATAQTSGPYTLQVTVQDDGEVPGNLYDLSFVAEVPPCLFDWAEPNDAANLVWELGPQPNHPGLVVCEPNDDWFSRDLFEGDLLELDLFFEHAEGDIDLELYGPTFNPLASSTSQTDDEGLVFEVPDTGRYFFKVTMPADAGTRAGNVYTLRWQQGTTSTCPTDVAEPNNSVPDGQNVVPATVADLRVCEDDPDFFLLSLPQNNPLVVTLDFEHAEGDLALELVDFDGVSLASSNGSVDGESLTYTSPVKSGGIVEVTLVADSGSVQGTPYTLTTSYGTPICAEDGWEVDDGPGDAQLMSEGPNILRTVCTGNDDWWRILGLAGEPLAIEAVFDQAEGNIDLELHDADGVLLTSATSSTDDELLTWTPGADGYVFLRVILSSDAGDPGNRYDVSFAGG